MDDKTNKFIDDICDAIMDLGYDDPNWDSVKDWFSDEVPIVKPGTPKWNKAVKESAQSWYDAQIEDKDSDDKESEDNFGNDEYWEKYWAAKNGPREKAKLENYRKKYKDYVDKIEGYYKENVGKIYLGGIIGKLQEEFEPPLQFNEVNDWIFAIKHLKEYGLLDDNLQYIESSVKRSKMKKINSSYEVKKLRGLFSDVDEDIDVEKVDVEDVEAITDTFDEPKLTKEDIVEAVEAIAKVADAVLTLEDKKDDEPVKVEEVLDKVEDIVELTDVPEEVVSDVVNLHMATGNIDEPASVQFDILPEEEGSPAIAIGDNSLEGFTEVEPVEEAEELIVAPDANAEEFEDKYVTIDSHWKDKSVEHKISWDRAEKKFKDKNERDPQSAKDYAAIMTIAKSILKKHFPEEEQYTEVAVSSAKLKPVLQALRKMIKSSSEEAYEKYIEDNPEMVEIGRAIIEKRTPETEDEWAEAYADLTSASIDSSKKVQSSKKSEAYNLGYDACKKKVAKTDPPFDAGTEQYDEWIRGYNEARKDKVRSAMERVQAPKYEGPKNDYTVPTVDKVTNPKKFTHKDVLGGEGKTVFDFDAEPKKMRVKIGDEAVEISIKKVSAGISLIEGENLDKLMNKVQILPNGTARMFVKSGLFGAIAVEGEYQKGIKNAVYGITSSAKGYKIEPVHTGSRGNVQELDVRTLVESAYVKALQEQKLVSSKVAEMRVLKQRRLANGLERENKVLQTRLNFVKNKLVQSKKNRASEMDEFKQKMVQESFKRELAENHSEINSSVDQHNKQYESNVDFLSRMM